MSVGRPWAMVAGAAGAEARIVEDFYPTPGECVTALLPYIQDFPQRVWEPACGDGAIVCELYLAGYTVTATDLVDRGCGGGVDFLKAEHLECPAIITNPPYGKGLAESFIRKAFLLEAPYIAMLLKGDFWNSQRNGLFEMNPPSRIHPLTWRPDFLGKGKPFLNVSWSVWRPADHSAQTVRLHRS